MEYSEDLPNQEGHYWMRSKTGFELVRRVLISNMDELCIWHKDMHGKDHLRCIERFPGYQWAGPIPRPDVN